MKYCEADIHYAADDMQPIRCDIHDGRLATLDFHTNGFELKKLPSNVVDWLDDDELVRVHYPEIEAFCKAWSGCAHVVFLPHIHRHSDDLGNDLAVDQQGPILGAHADYTEKYWDMIGDPAQSYAKGLAPSLERAGISYADIRNASRVITVQLWRNFGAPRMNYPLALCDSRSLERSDFVEVPVNAKVGGYDMTFEALVLTCGSKHDGPDRHRWYTFTDMTEDEVIVFRAFDSERIAAGENYCVGHTGFRDPGAPEANHRKSLEMRAICLF